MEWNLAQIIPSYHVLQSVWMLYQYTALMPAVKRLQSPLFIPRLQYEWCQNAFKTTFGEEIAKANRWNTPQLQSEGLSSECCRLTSSLNLQLWGNLNISYSSAALYLCLVHSRYLFMCKLCNHGVTHYISCIFIYIFRWRKCKRSWRRSCLSRAVNEIWHTHPG